jgi:hypothetical protein
MENKLMEIIYDKIKDINFYNYDNDEDFKNVCTNLYENIEREYVIDIALENKVFTIHCFESYADKEIK